MSMTTAVQSTTWNSAATFGVALVSASVALAVNKFCSHYFEANEVGPSSNVMRSFAFLAGAAVGLYAFDRTTVVALDFDRASVIANLLYVMIGLNLAKTAYYYDTNELKKRFTYASASILTLTAPFISYFGKDMLIPAVGIGAAVGSYL